MDDFTFWERNLFLLAIVVISLVQWIFGKLQERRQRRGDALDRGNEEDEVFPTRGEARSRERDAGDGESMPDELRRFFEALGVDGEEEKESKRKEERAREREQPPPARSTPPPVPPAPAPASRSEAQPPSRRPPRQRGRTSAPAPTLTRAEQRALETIRSGKGGPIVVRPAMQRQRLRSSAGWRRGPLGAMLASPESLRSAILLKEILDPPVALRDGDGGAPSTRR